MSDVRVNETKGTGRNAFIDNFFTLEIEEESRNDDRILLSDYPQILDLFVNH